MQTVCSMRICGTKTKVMVHVRNNKITNITLDGRSTITEGGRIQREIVKSIFKAKRAYQLRQP